MIEVALTPSMSDPLSNLYTLLTEVQAFAEYKIWR